MKITHAKNFIQTMFGALLIFLGDHCLAHEFKDFPPFSLEGEFVVSDAQFESECVNAMRVALSDIEDSKITNWRISRNRDFGLVCRADFSTPDDLDNSVNRLMFWRLPTGELREFAGFNIPATPLK